MSDYQFTNNWFQPWIRLWSTLLSELQPASYLEIGCFEGQSLTFVLEYMSNYCRPAAVVIDPFVQTVNGNIVKDSATESVFRQNLNTLYRKLAPVSPSVDLLVEYSSTALASLLSSKDDHRYDLIYIDGSHEPIDVLTDAALCFNLTSIGGVMVFDDYLSSAKVSVDAFVNIFSSRLEIMQIPANGQVFCRRIS